MPEEYENELSNLLDNCPTKTGSVIQSVISEFGKDLNEIFSDFDEILLVLNQLPYRATLKEGGKKVIVKVQYPDVEKYFRLDFQTMKFQWSLTTAMATKSEKFWKV